MSKLSYSNVVIIYNPMSTTGKAYTRAARLAERLTKRGLKKVTTVATEHAGHAEELAYRAACEDERPLIISVSGDGGYNEVINGVMRAQGEDFRRQPVCAIVAAGNSNDHRRSFRKHPLSWAITHLQPENQSLLRITVNHAGHRWVRYAHSYIGFGLSGQAANLLNQEKYTRWQDFKIVMKTIFFFKPVSIEVGGRSRRYDSLVFLIANHMSRVFRVGPKGELNSTTFKIAAMEHHSRWWLLFRLLVLLVFGVQRPPEETSYHLTVPQDTHAHLDGEDVVIPAKAKVQIDIVADALRSLR